MQHSKLWTPATLESLNTRKSQEGRFDTKDWKSQEVWLKRLKVSRGWCNTQAAAPTGRETRNSLLPAPSSKHWNPDHTKLKLILWFLWTLWSGDYRSGRWTIQTVLCLWNSLWSLYRDPASVSYKCSISKHSNHKPMPVKRLKLVKKSQKAKSHPAGGEDLQGQP